MTYDKDLVAHLEAISAPVYEQGRKLFEKIRKDIEAKHWGQYIIINIENSEYIIAPSLAEARSAFRTKHGNAQGWCSRIGIPILAH